MPVKSRRMGRNDPDRCVAIPLRCNDPIQRKMPDSEIESVEYVADVQTTSHVTHFNPPEMEKMRRFDPPLPEDVVDLSEIEDTFVRDAAERFSLHGFHPTNRKLKTIRDLLLHGF